MLAGGLVLILPRPTQAGFFAALARFFDGSPAEVEERSPVLVRESHAASTDSAIGGEIRPPAVPDGETDTSLMTVSQENAIVAPLNPNGIMSNGSFMPSQIFIYTVKLGDTPSAIAKTFGITVNTLLWANDISDARRIKPGDEIIVFPISGVQIEVKKGNTIDSIAKQYRGNVLDIASFNGRSPDEPLTVGTTLFIPDGEFDWRPVETSGPSRYTAEISRYPSFGNYYRPPLNGGRKSRGIHGYNGVDLVQSCGSFVYASASGKVLVARSAGWNGGYGNYIVIAHPNGTQTVYAHLSSVLVAVGQVVEQGYVIGTVGSTGNSTGCHLHWEIRGAAMIDLYR